MASYSYKNFPLTPISKLKVGDMIFGSGIDEFPKERIERAEDSFGLSFNLLMRFYRVLKINPSSLWVLDVLERKRYKLAKWYWDGSGELRVRKVPERFMKEVESDLVGESLEYRLSRGKTKPIAKISSDLEFKTLSGGELYRQILSKDDGARSMKYLRGSNLRDDLHFIFLQDGKLVADCELQENPYDSTEWWLMHIVTRVGFEHRGYASRLIREVLRFVSTSDRKNLKFSHFSEQGQDYVYPVTERMKLEFPGVNVIYDERTKPVASLKISFGKKSLV